jgi:hypothetical protein
MTLAWPPIASRRGLPGGVIPRGAVTRSGLGAVHDEHQRAVERDGIAHAVKRCLDPVALGQKIQIASIRGQVNVEDLITEIDQGRPNGF